MADSSEKPKSLADLEIEQKTTEVESTDSADHEHEHSDELSFREDPGQIKRTHGLLIAISLGGLAIVLITVGFMFTLFEANDFEEQVPQELSIEEQSTLNTLTGAVFYYNDGEDAKASFVDSNDTANTMEYQPRQNTKLSTRGGLTNPTWQMSTDGKVLAYQPSGKNEIIIETAQAKTTAFAEQSISSINDWVLVSDGSRIIATVASGGKIKLLDYNITTLQTVEGDDNFTIGGNKSRLFHGQDGYVRQFSFTGSEELSYLEYDLSAKTKEVKTISSPRFPESPQMLIDGGSPDGTLYTYSFVYRGQSLLGMAALNSQTVRTIYQTNATINDIEWAPDSRTILVLESDGGFVKRLIKLDTGPLTTETIIDANTEGLNPGAGDVAINPAWSRDAKQLAFYSGGSIWSYNIESKSLISLASNQAKPGSSSIYGWYSRFALD